MKYVKYYRLRDVARWLQAGRTAVGRWFDEGKLKGVRIGKLGERRVSGASIRAYMKQIGMEPPADFLEQDGQEEEIAS